MASIKNLTNAEMFEKFIVFIRQKLSNISPGSIKTFKTSDFVSEDAETIADIPWFDKEKVNEILEKEKLGKIIAVWVNEPSIFVRFDTPSLMITIRSWSEGSETSIKANELLEKLETAVKNYWNHLDQLRPSNDKEINVDARAIDFMIMFGVKTKQIQKIEYRYKKLRTKLDSIPNDEKKERKEKKIFEKIQTEYNRFEKCKSLL